MLSSAVERESSESENEVTVAEIPRENETADCAAVADAESENVPAENAAAVLGSFQRKTELPVAHR